MADETGAPQISDEDREAVIKARLWKHFDEYMEEREAKRPKRQRQTSDDGDTPRRQAPARPLTVFERFIRGE